MSELIGATVEGSERQEVVMERSSDAIRVGGGGRLEQLRRRGRGRQRRGREIELIDEEAASAIGEEVERRDSRQRVDAEAVKKRNELVGDGRDIRMRENIRVIMELKSKR